VLWHVYNNLSAELLSCPNEFFPGVVSTSPALVPGTWALKSSGAVALIPAHLLIREFPSDDQNRTAGFPGPVPARRKLGPRANGSLTTCLINTGNRGCLQFAFELRL
jgi:hypothetical protein